MIHYKEQSKIGCKRLQLRRGNRLWRNLCTNG